MRTEIDDGYVTELEYTHRYCPDLAPSRIALACAARGLRVLQNPSPRYLEMAFGQGVSINIHAAASPGKYAGFDFNPRHAANARRMADRSGSRTRLDCESFESFAARDRLPEFDIIAMHGTWSWISEDNRSRVIEILRRSLAPDGVCFISYNCLPGWAAEIPIRQLLMLHAGLAQDAQPLATRIDASLEFAQQLHDAGAACFDAHPRLAPWLQSLHAQSRNYLAHEYFNRDWHPMPFSKVARELAEAGLEFGASASPAGQQPMPGLDQKARALLEGIAEPVLRETTLDFLTNRRFRRDIFVKVGQPVAPGSLEERIGTVRFTLLQHPEHVPVKAMLAGIAIDLPQEIYRPFVVAMAAKGYAPKTIREVAEEPGCNGIPRARLAEAALVLTDAGSLHPAQDRNAVEVAEPRCRALNALILERAESSADISALACPVTGAGVFAAREEMLFLRAKTLGHASEDAWAQYAWEKMGEGDPAVLRSAAQAFARFRLPVLEALRIA